MAGFFLTSLISGLLPSGGLGDALGSLARRAASGGFEPREGPRLQDLAVQTTGHGRVIPRVYGSVRLAGNIIWARPITERRRIIPVTTSVGGVFGILGAGRLLSAGRVEYEYFASFAVGFAQGPILGIRRIWADETLIWSADPAAGLAGIAASAAPGRHFRLYRGTADQAPDPLILAHEGAAATPAFRDLAYLVFQNLPLAPYGNRVPLIEAEIVRGSPVVAGVDPAAFASVTPVARDGLRRLPSPIAGTPIDVLRGPAGGIAGDNAYAWTDACTSMDTYTSMDGGAEDGAIARHVTASDMANRVRHVARQRSSGGRWLAEERWSHAIPLTSARRGCAWAPADRPVQLYARDGEAAAVFVEIETGRHRLVALPGMVAGDVRGVSAWGTRIWILGGRPGGLLALWALDDSGSDVEATMILDGLPAARTLMRGDDAGLLLLSAARLRHLDGLTATADRDQTLNPWPDQRPVGLHRAADGIVVVVFTDRVALIDRAGRVATTPVEIEPGHVVGFAAGGGRLMAVPWVPAGDNAAWIDRWLALTRPAETADLGAVIADLAQAAGVDPDELDLTGVSGMALRGYVVARQGSAREALEPLLASWFVDAVERDGRLAFVPRGGPVAAVIDPGRLGAHGAGDEPPPLVERTRIQQAEMPREIGVAFIDGAADGRPGLARARRSLAGAEDRQAVELPLVLTADEAARIARTLADETLVGRDRWRFRLGFGDLLLEPGDVIALAPDPRLPMMPARLRIERMAFGTPGLIEVEAVADHDGLHATARPGADDIPPVTTAPARAEGLAEVTVLDLPPVVEPAPDPGLVVMVTGGGGGLRAARVEVADRADGPWREVAVLAPAASGTATTLLATGPATLRDDLASVTVDFGDDLRVDAGITEADAESGRSLALVGAEILSFGAIERVSAGLWRLSRLRRGLRGTEAAIGAHAIGETVHLLDPERLAVMGWRPADIGAVLHFRAVTPAGTIGPTRIHSLTGAGLRPFRPVDLQAKRQTDGSVLIRWLRADRLAGWTDGADEPMSETAERYQLDILASPTETAAIRRTVIVEGAGSWSYSAAQQYADFFTSPATLGLKVAQIGAATGPGPARYATVVP
ncbi:phage tail protein [Tistrella mobilis]|uniref:phage tail protein n=1 Tax=Tistrella mobilis TaxID=171437 RepID=UPI0035585F28